MNNRLKILATLSALIALGGAASLLMKQDKSSSRTNRSTNQIAELPKSEAPKDFVADCIPPDTTSKGKVIKVGEYSLYRLEYNIKQSSYVVDKGYEHLGNDRANSVALPNFDMAVLKENPLEGCKSVRKSMLSDKLPDDIPLKLRVNMRKAFWLLRLEAVDDELKIPGEKWVKHALDNPGIPGISFFPLDLKALKVIGVAVPAWYDPDVSQEEREKRLNAERVRSSKIDHQHWLDKTGPYAP